MNAPRFSGFAASSRSTAQAILLAAALLFAQWVGMLHRIDHAGGQAETQAQQSRLHGSVPGGSSASHSCVVFDGAYLADLLPTILTDLVTARIPHALPAANAFASWQGRFISHFQPRAPPAA
jgi:hypothetical protein